MAMFDSFLSDDEENEPTPARVARRTLTERVLASLSFVAVAIVLLAPAAAIGYIWLGSPVAIVLPIVSILLLIAAVVALFWRGKALECPKCGRHVKQDAVVCWHCGQKLLWRK
jgi:hypothetical protein